MEVKLEEVEEEVPKLGLVCRKELEEDYRFSELEERCKKAEARCLELELEVQKRKSENEALQSELKALEVEKLAIENELEGLKNRNVELHEQSSHVEERVADVVEKNDDKVTQLMIENNVLECEKGKAESEVQVWKRKVKELESLVLQLRSSSTFRSVEQPLARKINIGFVLPDLNCDDAALPSKTSEAIELEGEANIGNSFNQTKEKVINLVGAGSTSNSHRKEIGEAGTPYNDTPYKCFTSVDDNKRCAHLSFEGKYVKQVRRHLAFEDDKSPSKKIAPSTPAVARPASLNIINILDSDDESDMADVQTVINKNQNNNIRFSTDQGLEVTPDAEKQMRAICKQSSEEKLDDYEESIPIIPTPKRKRAFKIVTSDTEGDDDDNIPISQLMKRYHQEVIPDQAISELEGCQVSATSGFDNVRGSETLPRRRLVPLRQFGKKGGEESRFSRKTSETNYHQGIPTTEDVKDNDSEEPASDSDSDSDSLNGFIVNDSDVSYNSAGSESKDVSDCDEVCRQDVSDGDDAHSKSQDVLESDTDLDAILSTLKRDKDHRSVWEFEADMLAAFGKDPQLCMKAVCALYRQQTSDEKSFEASFYCNRRGFSKIDAYRGCKLGDFLTGGDPQGDLKKSVKELEDHDPKAVELCRTLALRYSKQLFEIYKNKEDPYFLPS